MRNFVSDRQDLSSSSRIINHLLFVPAGEGKLTFLKWRYYGNVDQMVTFTLKHLHQIKKRQAHLGIGSDGVVFSVLLW